MTCTDYRRLLLEAARGQSNAAAVTHARECADCERYLANQRSLTEGLNSLAQSALPEPPLALELNLLAHFAPVRRVRRFPRIVAASALAAAAALAASWIFFAARPSGIERPTVPSALIQTAPVETANIPLVPVPRKHARRSLVHARANTPVAEPMYQFILIPYAEPLQPTERAEIVRVNMPASALTTMGLPVVGADPDLRLNADLVLGENGLARAVRVLR